MWDEIWVSVSPACCTNFFLLILWAKMSNESTGVKWTALSVWVLLSVWLVSYLRFYYLYLLFCQSCTLHCFVCLLQYHDANAARFFAKKMWHNLQISRHAAHLTQQKSHSKLWKQTFRWISSNTAPPLPSSLALSFSLSSDIHSTPSVTSQLAVSSFYAVWVIS